MQTDDYTHHFDIFFRAMDKQSELSDGERIAVFTTAASLITKRLKELKDRERKDAMVLMAADLPKYQDRERREELPWEFLLRHYGRFAHTRDSSPLIWLNQSMLRQKDFALYRSLHTWCANNNVDPNSIVRRTRVSVQQTINNRPKKRAIGFQTWLKRRGYSLLGPVGPFSGRPSYLHLHAQSLGIQLPTLKP